jgi:CBS domain-containing protein
LLPNPAKEEKLMSVKRVCIKDVLTVAEDTDVLELARLMGDEHVGCVVVVRDRRPVGILTDRDVVLKVVAAGSNPADVQARDIMSRDLVTAGVDDDPLDVTRIMRDKGLRRVPVVDTQGMLAGIVTLDDLFLLLASEIWNLAGAVESGVRLEVRASSSETQGRP